MPLPLFPPTSEDTTRELTTKLQPLTQLLNSCITIPNYLQYKSRIVSLTLDALYKSLHILQSKHLPPSPSTPPRAFISFATQYDKLQSEMHALEWQAHFLQSPLKIQESMESLLNNEQALLPPPPLFSQSPNQTSNPALTNTQIASCYTLLLTSLLKQTSFRQPNGLGRNSRSFAEKRFRDNVLAYSHVEDRGIRISSSGVPNRLRPRKNWCHVQGEWSGRETKMVRIVPLGLVSRKVASLFTCWDGGEFEGLFLEGGNGLVLHEPFATAVSQGILVLSPTSLNEAGEPTGYQFILTDQRYAEKESGRGLCKNFNNKPFLPSPLNTRNNLPSLKFIYFRLLLTYITHLHLGKSTEWFTSLLQENPSLLQPKTPPFKGEMVKFLLNFAAADWDTKQILKGLGSSQTAETKQEKKSDWKEALNMALGIKVDCVSFGMENERRRIEEEQRSLDVAVDGLFEVADTMDIEDGDGDGSGSGSGNHAGFLIRVVLDDADDEGESQDIVLEEVD